MSFICVICRDLLKINEDTFSSSPRHQSPIQNGLLQSATTNHASTAATPTHNSNNVPGRKKEKNNSIVATKCGHLFHYPCLSVWLSQSMNLTTDSKMRCPSCKQLIYIYELIQLFPVENGVGSGCSGNGNITFEHVLSSSHFQKNMKGMMEKLENLIRDLGEKKTVGKDSPERPMKGNGTPKLNRSKDSPKKVQASQLAELMRDLDSVRKSIKELSLCLEQHAELGSVVEKQSQEISELKSRNEQLMQANSKRLKSNENGGEEKTGKVTQKETDSSLKQKEEIEQLSTGCATAQHVDDISETAIKTAQDLGSSTENHVIDPPRRNSHNEASDKLQSRRKSVTFLDPFDEFDEASVKTSISFNAKDLRIGDKVVWKFEGNPEIGTVKWKGFIGSQVNVGVEFEKLLGLPIKDLSCDPVQCIFKSKPGHGRLIPVYELTLLEKTMIHSQLDLRSNDQSNLTRVQSPKDGSTNNFNKRIPICTHQ